MTAHFAVHADDPDIFDVRRSFYKNLRFENLLRHISSRWSSARCRCECLLIFDYQHVCQSPSWLFVVAPRCLVYLWPHPPLNPLLPLPLWRGEQFYVLHTSFSNKLQRAFQGDDRFAHCLTVWYLFGETKTEKYIKQNLVEEQEEEEPRNVNSQESVSSPWFVSRLHCVSIEGGTCYVYCTFYYHELRQLFIISAGVGLVSDARCSSISIWL